MRVVREPRVLASSAAVCGDKSKHIRGGSSQHYGDLVTLYVLLGEGIEREGEGRRGGEQCGPHAI